MSNSKENISIVFHGGTFDEDKEKKLPDEPGLYCVYRCIPDILHIMPRGLRLIYIGKTDRSIRERILKHEKREMFEAELQKGEVLYFTWSEIDSEADKKAQLSQMEAALIHYFRPKCNEDFTKHFLYPDTHVEITDRFGKLEGSIDVECTEKPVELL